MIVKNHSILFDQGSAAQNTFPSPKLSSEILSTAFGTGINNGKDRQDRRGRKKKTTTEKKRIKKSYQDYTNSILVLINHIFLWQTRKNEFLFILFIEFELIHPFRYLLLCFSTSSHRTKHSESWKKRIQNTKKKKNQIRKGKNGTRNKIIIIPRNFLSAFDLLGKKMLKLKI